MRIPGRNGIFHEAAACESLEIRVDLIDSKKNFPSEYT
jgi:hypothetical protein